MIGAGHMQTWQVRSCSTSTRHSSSWLAQPQQSSSRQIALSPFEAVKVRKDSISGTLLVPGRTTSSVTADSSTPASWGLQHLVQRPAHIARVSG